MNFFVKSHQSFLDFCRFTSFFQNDEFIAPEYVEMYLELYVFRVLNLLKPLQHLPGFYEKTGLFKNDVETSSKGISNSKRELGIFGNIWEFFGNSLEILWEFFGNSLGIL